MSLMYLGSLTSLFSLMRFGGLMTHIGLIALKSVKSLLNTMSLDFLERLNSLMSLMTTMSLDCLL